MEFLAAIFIITVMFVWEHRFSLSAKLAEELKFECSGFYRDYYKQTVFGPSLALWGLVARGEYLKIPDRELRERIADSCRPYSLRNLVQGLVTLLLTITVVNLIIQGIDGI